MMTYVRAVIVGRPIANNGKLTKTSDLAFIGVVLTDNFKCIKIVVFWVFVTKSQTTKLVDCTVLQINPLSCKCPFLALSSIQHQ
jgi:hypothetical protein